MNTPVVFVQPTHRAVAPAPVRAVPQQPAVLPNTGNPATPGLTALGMALVGGGALLIGRRRFRAVRR